MLAGIILKALFLFPAVILFVTGYLLLESHSLGYKISGALSVGFIAGAIYNAFDPYLLLFCGFLCLLAAIISFPETRRVKVKINQAIVTENIAKFALRLSGLICVALLFGLIAYIAFRGVEFLSLKFIFGSSVTWKPIQNAILSGDTTIPGGIRDFVLGSLIVVGYCEAIAMPLGIGAAIFLSEYAPDNAFISGLRFFIETLAGAPSVVIGLFGFIYFVNDLHMMFSLPAVGLSLAFMILPWNIRVAEEAMRAVPQAYREASYALGAKKWQTIRSTVLLPASPGAITGILLGLGAAIGESAVVILTASGKGVGYGFLPSPLSLAGGKSQQMPVLSVWIYQAWANLPGSGVTYTSTQLWECQNVAYTGALVLILIFFAISVSALLLRNYLAKKTRAG